MLAVAALFLALSSSRSIAQESLPKASDTIRGKVINSVTHEPIGRALVFSPDNQFATMTDSYGVFEFTISSTGMDRTAAGGLAEVFAQRSPNRPFALTARKPGFLSDPDDQGHPLDLSGKDITISLTPEALIVGHVALPSSQPPDPIGVEIFRREVQDGRSHWTSVKQIATRSNGEFRFAELPAGTYKLLTHESLDRDPLTSVPGKQAYGYPPSYYTKASDFASAAMIHLTPGKTYDAQLSLVRQPYYPIKIPVAGASPEGQIGVMVSISGRHGPGFELGYNQRDLTIEGLLPSGSYRVEAVDYGISNGGGAVTINVNGPLTGPTMTVVGTPPIPVHVQEQFANTQPPISTYQDGSPANVQGPRNYLNVTLNGDDDFSPSRGASLRPANGPQDTELAVGNASPGRYWVSVSTGRGYVASVTSGGVDLLHQPLVIPVGAEVSPIEVTLRDDSAELDGVIEGAKVPSTPNASPGAGVPVSAQLAYIYCIPSPDSPGQYRELGALGNGEFRGENMPPGVYHLLAFSRPQRDLEYRNPEAMRAYDGKGQVVRLSPGQKEQVRLTLIAGSE